MQKLQKIASDLHTNGDLSLENWQIIQEMCKPVDPKIIHQSQTETRETLYSEFIRLHNIGVYYPDFPDKEEFWPAMIVPKCDYDQNLVDKVGKDEILLYFFDRKMLNIKQDDQGWQKWDENLEFFKDFVEKYWDFPDYKIRLAARFRKTGELNEKYKWKAWVEKEKLKNYAQTPQCTPEKKRKREKVEEKEKCLLCPSSNGIFLKTQHGKLVHRLCAELMPETHIEWEGQHEVVMGVQNIHEERWGFLCLVCKKKGSKYGSCIQCQKCANSIHATCAEKADLLVEDDGFLKFYCIMHNVVKKLEKSRKKEKELMDLGKTFIKGTLVTCHWNDGLYYQAKVVSLDLENKTCTLHFNGQPKHVLYHNIPWSKMCHLKSAQEFDISESDDWTDKSDDDSSVKSVHTIITDLDDENVSRNRYTLRKGSRIEYRKKTKESTE